MSDKEADASRTGERDVSTYTLSGKLLPALGVMTLCLMLSSTSSLASTPLGDAAEAMEDCESAWFERGRREALDRIKSAGDALVATIDPLGPDAAQKKADLATITEWMRQCMDILYGG